MGRFCTGMEFLGYSIFAFFLLESSVPLCSAGIAPANILLSGIWTEEGCIVPAENDEKGRKLWGIATVYLFDDPIDPCLSPCGCPPDGLNPPLVIKRPKNGTNETETIPIGQSPSTELGGQLNIIGNVLRTPPDQRPPPGFPQVAFIPAPVLIGPPPPFGIPPFGTGPPFPLGPPNFPAPLPPPFAVPPPPPNGIDGPSQHLLRPSPFVEPILKPQIVSVPIDFGDPNQPVLLPSPVAEAFKPEKIPVPIDFGHATAPVKVPINFGDHSGEGAPISGVGLPQMGTGTVGVSLGTSTITEEEREKESLAASLDKEKNKKKTTTTTTGDVLVVPPPLTPVSGVGVATGSTTTTSEEENEKEHLNLDYDKDKSKKKTTTTTTGNVIVAPPPPVPVSGVGVVTGSTVTTSEEENEKENTNLNYDTDKSKKKTTTTTGGALVSAPPCICDPSQQPTVTQLGGTTSVTEEEHEKENLAMNYDHEKSKKKNTTITNFGVGAGIAEQTGPFIGGPLGPAPLDPGFNVPPPLPSYAGQFPEGVPPSPGAISGPLVFPPFSGYPHFDGPGFPYLPPPGLPPFPLNNEFQQLPVPRPSAPLGHPVRFPDENLQDLNSKPGLAQVPIDFGETPPLSPNPHHQPFPGQTGPGIAEPLFKPGYAQVPIDFGQAPPLPVNPNHQPDSALHQSLLRPGLTKVPIDFGVVPPLPVNPHQPISGPEPLLKPNMVPIDFGHFPTNTPFSQQGVPISHAPSPLSTVAIDFGHGPSHEVGGLTQPNPTPINFNEVSPLGNPPMPVFGLPPAPQQLHQANVPIDFGYGDLHIGPSTVPGGVVQPHPTQNPETLPANAPSDLPPYGVGPPHGGNLPPPVPVDDGSLIVPRGNKNVLMNRFGGGLALPRAIGNNGNERLTPRTIQNCKLGRGRNLDNLDGEDNEAPAIDEVMAVLQKASSPITPAVASLSAEPSTEIPLPSSTELPVSSTENAPIIVPPSTEIPSSTETVSPSSSESPVPLTGVIHSTAQAEHPPSTVVHIAQPPLTAVTLDSHDIIESNLPTSVAAPASEVIPLPPLKSQDVPITDKVQLPVPSVASQDSGPSDPIAQAVAAPILKVASGLQQPVSEALSTPGNLVKVIRFTGTIIPYDPWGKPTCKGCLYNTLNSLPNSFHLAI